MANRVNLYCGKRLVSWDTKSWNILQWSIHLLWPHPHASGYPPFSKNMHPHVRSIFKSFSPVHTTEKAETMEIREHPFRSMRHARSIWCMTSTYLKTSIFVCPHVNEKPAFSKTLLWRVFLKRCVFGDCFQWIRVDGLGQTGDKNPHFQTKMDMCVDAWGYVLQQWIGFNWHATVICLKCLDNIVNWILTSQSGLKLSDTN